MYKRQKIVLIKFVAVVVITVTAVVAMVILKDFINRSEAMRAMSNLSEEISEYKKENGIIPPEPYVESIINNLVGHLRLGGVKYRGRWIGKDCSADEIVAYSKKRYHFLIGGTGYVVLRFDGRVEWMNSQKFKTLLDKQQSPLEVELTKHEL